MDEAPARFARFARNVWHVEEADDTAAALAGIAKQEAFFRSIGMPVRLGELSCGKQDEAGLADLASRCSYGKHARSARSACWTMKAFLRSTAGPTKREEAQHEKLAILGPGVVGGSCAEILLRDADLLERNAGEQLELSYVLARRALPDRPYKDKVVTDFSVIEHDADVFLVIETIGGCGAALEYVRRALAAGKHVVTANKQLIAEHGAELLALAKANGVSLLFEASVGGGIPVLHPLSQCLGANEIYEVRGILNGTTNLFSHRCSSTDRATKRRSATRRRAATPSRTRPPMSRASTRAARSAFWPI